MRWLAWLAMLLAVVAALMIWAWQSERRAWRKGQP